MECIKKPRLTFHLGDIKKSEFKDNSLFASGVGFQVFENTNKMYRVT